MKSRFRGLRPSPAMVVACVALLVALAGTSVAAVTIVIPRNSVGSLQLKANSVNFFEGPERLAAQGRLQGRPGPGRATRPSRPRGPRRPGRPGRRRRRGRGRPARLRRRDPDADEHELGRHDVDVVRQPSTPARRSNVTVPANETDKLIVSFSAEDACYGGTSATRCNCPDHGRQKRARSRSRQRLRTSTTTIWA